MSPPGQVHREIDVPPECPESSGMEPTQGGDVASHGANGQVLVATGKCLLDNSADELAANPVIPGRLGDDDRLDFAAPALVEQAGQTYDAAVGLGHPGSDPLRRGQVVI